MKRRFFFQIGFFFLFLGVNIWGSIPCFSSETDSLKEEAYRLVSAGNEAVSLNDYGTAEEKLNEAIGVWNKISGYDEYRAYPYYSLGILYRVTGNFSKSLSNFLEAEKILLNARDEYMFLLASIYSSIGKTFIYLGDYRKSFDYFDKAISIVEQPKYYNRLTMFDVQMNKAQSYLYLGDYQKAIDIGLNYINSINPLNKCEFENFIGSCLIKQKKYIEAIVILEKSLNGFTNNSERFTEAFLTTTQAYIRSGDIKTSEKYLEKSWQLLKTNKPSIDPWVVFYYELKGEFLVLKASKSNDENEKLHLYQEALEVINKGLLLNSNDPGKKRIPYIDYDGAFVTPMQVKDLMINRAHVLGFIAQGYLDSGDKISGCHFQQLALHSWEATVHFLHDFRDSFLEEESKLSLSESQINVYYEGFALAAALYRDTGRKEFFDQMLFFSESAKSSTLLGALNAVHAKNFGGIPDSLLEKERNLQMQLSALNQMIFTERNKETPDTVLIGKWETNLFNVEKLHDELMFRFEQEYPNYYQMKYNDKLVTIADIQRKLDRNQAIIEYIINEPTGEGDMGAVNILYFTRDSYKLIVEPVDYVYNSNLKILLQQLSDHNVGETNLNDYRNFMRSSNYLYSILVNPIGIDHQITGLIVVPDGKLAYLSFDALVSSMPDSSRISFSSPEYLVKRFSFVYSYSATLLYNYFGNSASSNSKILAFAPQYDNINVDLNKAAYRARQANRAILRPLPGAKEEVEKLSEHFKCVSYIGESATEETFKKEAGNYGFLHLAMHTLMNDSLPLYSKLVFSLSPDSADDGYLNTQEIYNMKLNAKMAVLSACNTGSGKMRAGEGVMSMARAFLYAGCPSIVMTLWEVEDRSSASLVLNFYRYLYKGYSKPEALRLAKLEHLKTADPLKSHPYFWMGYIVVGDPSPIKKSPLVWSSTVFLILASGGIFAFRKKIKNLFVKMVKEG